MTANHTADYVGRHRKPETHSRFHRLLWGPPPSPPATTEEKK